MKVRADETLGGVEAAEYVTIVGVGAITTWLGICVNGRIQGCCNRTVIQFKVVRRMC